MKNKKSGRTANRKAISIVSLCVILALICASTLLAVHGMRFGKGGLYRVKSVGEAMSLGLDLRGGVYTVYQGTDPGDDTFEALLDGTISVLQNRLTGQGFTEATVTKQGTDRIRIEIPDVKDPNDILDIIGTPAVLEFKDATGAVVMEGKQVKTAKAGYQDSKPIVYFDLTDEGRETFGKVTAANIGKRIAITLDGRTISEPVVNTAITGGSGYIEGMASLQEAESLAMLIQSGALPLEIKQLEVSAISATLGVEALSRALTAGIIGVVLVMLFMLLRYRLCGLVADIALSIYILIVFFFLAISGIQLTLAGVLGIVLGIGMAVDANVVIFERVREELAIGRTLSFATKMGFHNALSAVMDANVTTIIAALVLMIFGTGTIKGFANTLAISVVVSMFTAIIVSRLLMKLFINMGISNTKLYTR
ncbi:MAG: protein translocase subunit SecD [Clostridia bacterium]